MIYTSAMIYEISNLVYYVAHTAIESLFTHLQAFGTENIGTLVAVLLLQHSVLSAVCVLVALLVHTQHRDMDKIIIRL